jgi:hypothetical protein
VDGNIQEIDIGTNCASSNVHHLFKLFEIKISSIEPALGIELFTLELLKLKIYILHRKNFGTKHLAWKTLN